MTIGVGGASMDTVLDALEPMREGIEPISNAEREQRQQHAQKLMREQGIDALYLDASASLYYFTGVRFSASERLHGAVLPAAGDLVYVTPAFEEEKTRAQLVMGDDIRTWEEHESPTALVIDTLRSLGSQSGTIAIDETTPFFVFDPQIIL